MAKSIPAERFTLGVCYYPEQWPETMWADDFRRMKEIGFNIVRVGEFAWNLFEPEEGVFQFDLFDRAIDLGHQYGLQVIIGTPTATPPAWMTKRYPEILNVNKEGVPYRHGNRRHYNYSSPIYRDYCAKITTAMARHYADHPAVVGWQIDNELNAEGDKFYSDADDASFRVWLADKYGSLDVLNTAWGTVFWNQSYSDWSEIHLPRGTVNPHQALDEKRFISDNCISFVQVQADIIRELAPKQWITTNGMFPHLNNHKMTNELLDFYSYDSYPNFTSIWNDDNRDHPLLDRIYSNYLTKTRSISPNYAIMEQQAGPGGWVTFAQSTPQPGQIRLWTYQSIAHGADMLLYFRWRTATFGTEIYWHGINDYHNQPNRRVAEVAQVGSEMNRIGEAIVGSRFAADVAILHDYDNEWDGELDVWHGPLTRESVYSWSKALQFNHVPHDYMYIESSTSLSDLQGYSVLIYPHAAILSDETAELLKQYVADGGKLIFGARTGYKDKQGQCRMMPFPGPAAELCGITVEEFTLLTSKSKIPSLRWADGEEEGVQATLFNDILLPANDRVETLAVYDGSCYYAGKPALTRNVYGEGEAYYYGAAFSYDAANALIRRLGMKPAAVDHLELPQQVEIAIREKDGRQFAFLLNYSGETVTARLLKAANDMLEDVQLAAGDLTIEPYGVKVLQLS